MSSPTRRTLAEMRKRDYTCAIVEHWNSFARLRQDLFGIIDVLCVKDGETVGVQCTSSSNVSSRIRKIADSALTPRLRAAGWRIIVHGWRKAANGRWTLREVDCS